MERLKRNPAGWGLILGGAIVVFSTFFVWLVVTHDDGQEARIRAIEDVTGQTILFLGVAAALCGLGVLASGGGGKYVWATFGLLLGVVVVAGAAWGIVDADGLAAQFAEVEAMSTVVSTTPDIPQVEAAEQAFADGTLSARVAFGLFIGLAGGLLAMLGALMSYRFTPPGAD